MKTFEEIASPEELFKFLETMKYGVIDKNGKKWTCCSSEKMNEICNSDWKLRSAEEILSDGVGHCYDFVEVERLFFEKHGFKIKTFWVCAYQKGVENSGFAHSFLAYKNGKNWFHFEISDVSNQGIHKFSNLAELKKAAKMHQIAYATSNSATFSASKSSKTNLQVITKPKFSVILTEFTAPPTGLNIFEYVDFVTKNS